MSSSINFLISTILNIWIFAYKFEIIFMNELEQLDIFESCLIKLQAFVDHRGSYNKLVSKEIIKAMKPPYMKFLHQLVIHKH